LKTAQGPAVEQQQYEGQSYEHWFAHQAEGEKKEG
jgi:hypothetical protein